jgi:NAD(P)-dependent dehydrogenase (short-subunit alcohol dehydrogenase family)
MGKASVKVFVREGARVVAADISGAEQQTAADAGDGVLPVHCDVSKEADVEAMMGRSCKGVRSGRRRAERGRHRRRLHAR